MSKSSFGFAVGILAGVGLSSLLSASAHAQGSATRPPTARAAQTRTPSDSATNARLREEDEFFQRRLMDLRARYLRGASWANLGDRCNPGALRVFAGDTSRAQRDTLEKILQRMEQTIVGRGAGLTNIDTPDGRALLRVIVGWEAGIDRPNWDSNEKTARQAIPTGLNGEYPDPNGKGCLHVVNNDTVTFVLPGFSDMIFPRDPNVRIKAYFGPESLNRVRNDFVTAHRNDPNAALRYVFISPFVIWRDWAVVVATRPIELGGVDIGRRNDGGAAYMMRKVGGEWRLLSILRSWGS